MDQVAAAVRYEGVALELLWVNVAPINRRACRAGEIAGSPASAFDWTWHKAGDAPARPDDPPWFFRANAVYLGSGPVHSDTGQRRGHGIERVSHRVGIIVHE